MWTKKHMMIQKKEDDKYERAVKMEEAKNKLSQKYNKKVESRLHVETTAMQEKKRTKFDPEKDSKAEAHTFGGRLPGR